MTRLKKMHVVEYIALINLQFPNAYAFADEHDRELFVNLWFSGLQDYPKELCDTAVRNSLFKAEFVPKIANILKEIETLLQAQQASESELWNELCAALRAVRRELPYACEKYNTVKHDETGLTTMQEARKAIGGVYDGLSTELKEYCGSMRGLMDLAQTDEENMQYEKGRFIKRLSGIAERIKTKRQTPPQLADVIKGLIENKTCKRIGDGNG